jgi:anti-sigma factor RsiW
MTRCDENRVNIALYVEQELETVAAEALRAHIRGCAECRNQLEEERSLSVLLRGSRPLYSAPKTLRARVAADLARKDTKILDRVLSKVTAWLGRGSLPRLWLVAAMLVVALALALFPEIARQLHSRAFVEAALAAHREYLQGSLPLEIRSDSPEIVSSWLARKVPFHFRLPDYQRTTENKSAYRLTGARLVNFRGSPAAMVTYAMAAEKISLLAASSKSSVAAGGEEIRFRGLTFHERSDPNFKVVTWTNHGITYALVSSLAGSGRHSCLVCHQNMTDFRVFQAMAPNLFETVISTHRRHGS